MVELPTATLLGVNAAARAALGVTLAEVRFELASRVAQPLLAVITALVGFTALFLGQFSRLGAWRQVLAAIMVFDRHSAFGQCHRRGRVAPGRACGIGLYAGGGRFGGGRRHALERDAAKGATMILARYFLRRLLGTAAMVSGVFLGMILLLDMVEQLRRLSGQDAGFGAVLRLSLLNTPEAFYEIAPLVMMLAALWLGLGWSRSSEFVVIRAAGRSVPRLLLVPGLVLLLAASGFVALMNPLVASSVREYQRSLAALQGGSGAVVALAGDELWLRQADRLGQTVIHARRAEDTGTVLFDASFFRVSRRARLVGAAASRPGRSAPRIVAAIWCEALALVRPESRSTSDHLVQPCHCN